MLIVSLFFLSYVFSAIRAKPDWGLALTNLVFPHGVELNNEYIKNYLLITMGVLGTTITPWGQFFISSFAFDKHIDAAKLKYSQLETYFGAFLTDFFSFFMIVATAATLFINRVVLESGEQAAMAIKPFAGEMAGFIYAFGILNAGIMGMIIISLSTAYAFSEFFGFTGSLDVSYGKGKLFYGIFLFQIIFASLLALLPNISLFSLALVTQTVNAIMLPLVFYFLINLTNNPKIMGSHTNSAFQRNFGYIASGIIIIASIITFIFMIFSN
jgi:Mn2+/Fe2+ NRAMP family transporter